MSGPLLFNPARAGDEELEQTFVGRAPLLEKLEKDLLADAAGTTSRHWLIVGPRGTGKSHVTELLSRRLHHGNQWDVVRMPEEQYQVASLADLLEHIVAGLIPAEEPSPFAAETDSRVVEEKALDWLRRRSKANPRRPLLVVLENLNLVLERKLTSTREQTRFREILMRNAPFHLVATSPSYVDAVARNDAPFYDFFQVINLQDLTREDVSDLVERRAHWDKDEPLLARLDQVRARVEALYHLSGGNPRLVLALYTILREGVSDELYTQFMKLLDDVTPYYQARLGDISPQMARVLTEIALGEGPQTPAEIARRCRMPTSQVTANISKLVEQRFVAPGARPDKRSRYYEVTDRLFRIWIQMREDHSARQRLRFLTEFFQRWYAGNVHEVAEAAVRVAPAFLGALTADKSWRCAEHLTTLEYLESAVPDSFAGVPFRALVVAFENAADPNDVVFRAGKFLGTTDQSRHQASLMAFLASAYMKADRCEQAIHLWRECLTADEYRAGPGRAAVICGYIDAVRATGGASLGYEEAMKFERSDSAISKVHERLTYLAFELKRYEEVPRHVSEFMTRETCRCCQRDLLLDSAFMMLQAQEASMAGKFLSQLKELGDGDAGVHKAREVARLTQALEMVVAIRSGESPSQADALKVADQWASPQETPDWLVSELACFFAGKPETAFRAVPYLKHIARRDESNVHAFMSAHVVATFAGLVVMHDYAADSFVEWISIHVTPSDLRTGFIQAAPRLAQQSAKVAGAILDVYRRLRENGLLSTDLEPYAAALRVRETPADMSTLHPEMREAVQMLLHTKELAGETTPSRRTGRRPAKATRGTIAGSGGDDGH